MDDFTSGQIKNLQTWTERRDSLLREIGIAQTELEALTKSTKDKGLALADLHNQISEVKGRLAELNALEERMKNSVSIEVAELIARKSRLEAECLEKEKESKNLDKRNSEIVSNIETLSLVHDKMSDQAKIVDEVVGKVIETSKTAISEMGATIAEIRTVSAEVIEKGKENISQTNIVLEKLPRYIFELQKPIPVRRTYAVPRGTQIEPEKAA